MKHEVPTMHQTQSSQPSHQQVVRGSLRWLLLIPVGLCRPPIQRLLIGPRHHCLLQRHAFEIAAR